MNLTPELVAKLPSAVLKMTEAERAELDSLLMTASRWRPLQGPQTQAYECTADVVLYGGSAGSGKTDLALGKSLTQHRRSLILRREYPQLTSIIERSREIYDAFGAFNESKGIWRCNYENIARFIEFGSCQLEHDKSKYQGRPHDLIVFDEASNFLESQVQFICGWLRSEVKGQRCQVLLPSNPPENAEGEWLLIWFAPWLDRNHPNPAQPGELRWFAMLDGKSVEVSGPEPFTHEGERIVPQSRTFIPGRVTDNPYYAKSGYVAKLQALPEPLRSKLLYGDFTAGREDAAFQVIPTAWVLAAQARWEKFTKPDLPMSALGTDVARGGKDSTVLTPRHGHWFGPQHVYPGATTPDGPAVTGLIIQHRADNCFVNIDVIGVGTSPYDSTRQIIGERAVAMNGSKHSTKRDRAGVLTFVNKRAEWYWAMRETLDPANHEDLMLPPDPALRADLCAPTWKMTVRGVQVESKEDLIKRLGRSPDRGDSAVYALADESDAWAFTSA